MATVQVNGRQLGYAEAGEGTPFLFIGGTASVKEYWWEYQVPFFARHYRVVTIDERCCGESDRTDEVFETRDLAADAVGILDAIGATAPAHILGHSMGGRVAQWIALDRPERVRSLTMVSSGSGQYDPNRPVDRCPPIWQLVKMIEMGFEAYTRNVDTGRLGFTDDFRAAHPEIPEKMFATWWASKPTALSYLLHTRARQRHETTDRLGEIGAPTLVLHGTEDTIQGGTSFHPESSRVLAERIPNAQLRKVEGAAHHIFWQRPEAINPLVLEFLQSN